MSAAEIQQMELPFSQADKVQMLVDSNRHLEEENEALREEVAMLRRMLFGKKSEKLFKMYQNLGLDVSFKLYPGARHELLREINKEEVYQDILNFLDQIAIR